MMKIVAKTFILIFFTVLGLMPTVANAQWQIDAERLKAAQQLLITMKEPEKIMQTANAMLASQAMNIAGMNREIMAKAVKSFIAKYLSWDKIKDQQATIYANAYTTAELKALNKFYQSALGKKVIQTTPLIQQQNNLMTQKIVMAHRAELINMFQSPPAKN